MLGTHQIVYLSRATRPVDDAELAQIEEIATFNNKRDGVTGLLAYDGTRFLQALEGGRDVLHRTLDRIRNDDRHASFDLITDRPVSAPEFGSFSIRIKKAEPGVCSRRFISELKEEVEVISDSALQALFIGFALLGCRPERG